MNVCFNSEIAKEYGISIAIILDKLHFWIDHNKANNKNFYDGRYWTFNSMDAWSKQIDFMTGNTIRRTLEKMEKEGLIVTGNYNASKYDRTKWYALTDKANSIFEDSQIHLANLPNQNGKNAEPIPTNYTGNYVVPPLSPTGETESPKEKEKHKDTTEEFIEKSVKEDFKPIMREWCQYKREKKQKYTPTGLRTCYAKLLKLSNGSSDTARILVEQSMANNWAGLFAVKDFSPKKQYERMSIGVKINTDEMNYDSSNDWG